MTRLVDLEIKDDRDLGRTTWTFPYDQSDLERASKKQATFHRSRQAYYVGEATRLEALLREKGIELREQQVTGGPQFSAVVDADLGKQLGEARTRRDSHERSARVFEAYAGTFLKGSIGTIRHLTIADVDFFALHREPGD